MCSHCSTGPLHMVSSHISCRIKYLNFIFNAEKKWQLHFVNAVPTSHSLTLKRRSNGGITGCGLFTNFELHNIKIKSQEAIRW